MEENFHVTLNAPTFWLQSLANAPVTFLETNKIYGITVLDTSFKLHESCRRKYRTTVQVFLDSEYHQELDCAYEPFRKVEIAPNSREIPIRESLAIECILQSSYKEFENSQPEVEKAFYDSFSVVWTSNLATGNFECLIPFRFNSCYSELVSQDQPNFISIQLRTVTERLASPDSILPLSRRGYMTFTPISLSTILPTEGELSDHVMQVENSLPISPLLVTVLEHIPFAHEARKTSSGNSIGQMVDQNLSPSELSTKLTFANFQEPAGMTYQNKDLKLLPVPKSDSDVSCQVVKPTIQKSCTKVSKDGALDRRQSSLLQIQGLAQAYNDPPKRQTKSTCETDLAPCVAKSAVVFKDKTTSKVCFYLRSTTTSNRYHRATYIKERTMHALRSEISKNFQVATTSIMCITFCSPNGFQVLVDDDILRDLPNGQDMAVEFWPSEVTQPTNVQFITSSHLPINTLSISPNRDSAIGLELDDFLLFSSPITEEFANTDFSGEAFLNRSQESVEMSLFVSPLDVFKGPLLESSSCSASPLEWGYQSGHCAGSIADVRDCPITNARSPENLTDGPNEHVRKQKEKPSRRASGAVASLKRTKLLQINRIAAARCRVTRKQRESELSKELKNKMRENRMLRSMVGILETESRYLSSYLAGHAEL